MAPTRRSVLAVLGASVPLAGCSGSTARDDSFSVTAPSIEQGERTTLSIEAPGVTTLHFSDLPGGLPPEHDAVVEVEYDDAAFTPRPDVTWTAHPPTWQWSPARDVAAAVPVRTFPDTPPGSYEFTIAISSDDEEQERTMHTTLTVESVPQG